MQVTLTWTLISPRQSRYQNSDIQVDCDIRDAVLSKFKTCYITAPHLRYRNVLSVLKSHFNPACSFVLNSCIVFCERRFVRTFDSQKDLASRRHSMMALGKRSWFGFRRFKKCWRAFATRAKAHSLDQNWQSLAHKAQRSNHWAKNANLTSQDVNHCDYKV